jgi:hypothetical protein
MELQVKQAALEITAKQFQASTNRQKRAVGQKIGQAASALADAITDLKQINS